MARPSAITPTIRPMTAARRHETPLPGRPTVSPRSPAWSASSRHSMRIWLSRKTHIEQPAQSSPERMPQRAPCSRIAARETSRMEPTLSRLWSACTAPTLRSPSAPRQARA